MKNSNVTIVDVGPRDGLQNEQVEFSTDDKLTLITRLIDAGLTRIEVASFVHPRLVPQMADAEAVVAGLPDRKDVDYIGLVLNKRGYMRALDTRSGDGPGIDEVGCVAVASDTFGEKNQGQTRAESVAACREILRLAARDGVSAQVTISAAFGCPFEGEIAEDTVLDMAEELAAEAPREIALADTIGVAVPQRVRRLFEKAADRLPGVTLRGHFHNTRNTGIANAWAAFEAGVSVLDASVGGLGGCPFAPKATGNIATEDLVYMLDRSGVETGVALDSLIAVNQWLRDRLGRQPPSMVGKAGGFPKNKQAAE